MKTPFEELGIRAWSDPDEVRAAYRALVKECHPDRVQDPALKEEAQQRMIRLNLAYEEALRLATPRQHAPYVREISGEEAVTLADRMLQRENPQGAMRQLMRADDKDAKWYNMYGRVLMRMDQYHEAHLAYREAVRLEPENNEYRSGALEASLAEKKERTLGGQIRKWARGLKRK